MNEEFQIVIEWLEGSSSDPVERACFADITIVADKQNTTELEDLFARTVRPGLRASAYDLATWLAENWWRLRWEPEAKNVGWRLSHVVAAAGGGIAWPNVSFASDGVHVLIEARRTPDSPVSPVRYLANIDVQVSADAFEAGIDEFIERVLARLSSVNNIRTELALLWQELQEERRDVQKSTIRRLEALMGFDAEDAPGELIKMLQARTKEAGQRAVEEVAASAKANALPALEDVLERARKSDVSIHVESAARINEFCAQPYASELPWQRAKRAAEIARDIWGVSRGPVSNKVLSEVLSIPESVMRYNASNGVPIGAGFRTGQDMEKVNVIMRAKVETGRRFEVMRLVADHIVMPADDRLLPVTSAKTDRQKFQRAFAQAFLLPFEELRERLDLREAEDDIGTDDIDDVANEYNVSPLLVRTTLVNQGFLSRALLSSSL